MANCGTAGSAGETAIGDQSHGAVDALVTDDRLSGHQHFGHTAATGTLIADDDDLTGIDLIVDHGIMGILFMVEHTSLGIDNLALIHGAGRIL